MTEKHDKTLVPKFLWRNGEEPPKSTGRSNCTLFLDHPELLNDWELQGAKLPMDIETPAYLRREKLRKDK